MSALLDERVDNHFQVSNKTKNSTQTHNINRSIHWPKQTEPAISSFYFVTLSKITETSCVVADYNKNINTLGHLWYRASHCRLKISSPRITLLMHALTHAHACVHKHTRSSMGLLKTCSCKGKPELFAVLTGRIMMTHPSFPGSLLFQADCIFLWRMTWKESDDIQIYYQPNYQSSSCVTCLIYFSLYGVGG